jgi:hypothetical protein
MELPRVQGPGKDPTTLGHMYAALSLHFCKRLFSGLERMTSWSQGNSFTAAPGHFYTVASDCRLDAYINQIY